MAPTVIAKKQASPSRCAGSKRGQLPRCRSKHRKGMSGANAYTATTELRYLIELFLPGNVAGQIFRSCMRQKMRGLRPGSSRRPRRLRRLRSRDAKRRGSPVRYAGLERQKYVEDLLAIAALLHIGNLAAASVRNTRLRDLVRVDRVVALDVFRSHNSCDDEFTNLKIDANFLLTLDHQVAVRQYLRHHAGDIRLQFFRPIDRALSVACRA